MKVFITGAEGFVGRKLFIRLIEHGFDASGSIFEFNENDDFYKNYKKNLFIADITNREEIKGLIDHIRPDIIVHLAAVTFVPHGDKDPQNVILTNIYGTQNLISAAGNLKNCHIIFASSSEVYGTPREGDLITEETMVKPNSIYAITKLTGEYIIKSSGISSTVLRLFNHTGIGQNPNFVIPNFAKQIVDIERSGRSELLVGNLESYKDFLDIEDIIDAYLSVIKRPSKDIYNICSGRTVKIANLVKLMTDYSIKPISILVDQERYRKGTGCIFNASNEKFRNFYDWQPKINISDTIKYMINYYRSKEDMS